MPSWADAGLCPRTWRQSVKAMLLLLLVAAAAAPADQMPARSTLSRGECVTPALQSKGFACGTLRVPENWSAKNGREVTLPFAIRRAAHPHADSVAFLIGGPGGTNIGFVPLIAPSFDTIDRDIVFLERRGAGFSQPSLRCSDELSREQLTDLSAIRACASALTAAGVDLDAYGTSAAAHDLEALRRLLGVKQWDLFGASYGTLHALTVMRDFPKSVRVAVLDSPLPPDADPFSEQTFHRMRSLSTVFEACRQQPACEARFPAVRERFLETIARLDKEPLEALGQRLDGDALLQFAVDSLESSYMSQRLPLAIEATAAQDAKRLASIVAPPAESAAAGEIVPPEKARIALGLWLSVECSERAAFAKSPRSASCAAWPGDLCARLDKQLQSLRNACKVWPVKPISTAAHAPVQSTIPTLIFTGEYDPITPTAWGQHAAQTLKHSQVLTVPGGGHTIAQEPCPMSIVRGLYESGSVGGDRSCLNVPRPPFLTSVD